MLSIKRLIGKKFKGIKSGWMAGEIEIEFEDGTVDKFRLEGITKK